MFLSLQTIWSERSRRFFRLSVTTTLLISTVLPLLAGCRSQKALRQTLANDLSQVEPISRAVDEPRVEIMQAALSSAPITVRDRARLEEIEYFDVTVNEILMIAMQNSEVLRDLGGVSLRNPDTIATRFNSGLRETDPRYRMRIEDSQRSLCRPKLLLRRLPTASQPSGSCAA
jgi:hypothetical protein